MIDAQITELKRKLREEKNFGAIMHAFLDLQEGLPDFMAKSKPRKAKLLEKMIEAGAGAAVGKRVRIGQFISLEHRASGLLHGMFMSATGHGSFFFFNDIRMGLGVLQVGVTSHSFRISADLWDEEGESIKGDISDVETGE